jgi:hypothetical protein
MNRRQDDHDHLMSLPVETYLRITGNFRPEDLDHLALANRQYQQVIHQSEHSERIWREAFQNVLKDRQANADQLARVASSEYSTEALLTGAVKHGSSDEAVRFRAAENRVATAGVFDAIIERRDAGNDSLGVIARRTKSSAQLLQLIGHPTTHSDEEAGMVAGILWYAANNRCATAEVLDGIASNAFADGATLPVVALHANATKAIVNKVIGHPRAGGPHGDEVRRIARGRLATMQVAEQQPSSRRRGGWSR